jgi:hypothetical protein
MPDMSGISTNPENGPGGSRLGAPMGEDDRTDHTNTRSSLMMEIPTGSQVRLHCPATSYDGAVGTVEGYIASHERVLVAIPEGKDQVRISVPLEDVEMLGEGAGKPSAVVQRAPNQKGSMSKKDYAYQLMEKLLEQRSALNTLEAKEQEMQAWRLRVADINQELLQLVHDWAGGD